MNAKSVPEDCDQRRRDKDVRISSVQFLRNQEIGTRSARKSSSMTITIMKRNIQTLRRNDDETMHIDFEERF